MLLVVGVYLTTTLFHIFLNHYAEKWADPPERRKFFENYASEKGFDPLNAENWYSVSLNQIFEKKKETQAVVVYHGHSVLKALLDLFPEVEFDKSQLLAWKWKDVRNRRKFFEAHARENNLDPLHPETWYSLDLTKLLYKKKGTQGVVKYHGRSVAQALLDLFPNIGLDRAKLVARRWVDREERRKVFEKFAKQHRFDPLIAENWYGRSLKKIVSAKQRAQGFLQSHGGKIGNALLELFPNIGLDREKLISCRPSSRRRFLVREPP